MNISTPQHLARMLAGFVLITVFSTPLSASVTYHFIVEEEPTGDFFKPLSGKIVLSNEAVTSGVATKGQIESVVINGGTAMQQANQITLSYLHQHFKDLTVNLSVDRKTISSVSATLAPGGGAINHWVFHYQEPTHPTLNIHEFVVNVSHNSINLEATILPTPPTTHYENFKGKWVRTKSCWICCLCDHFVAHGKVCWLDWVIIGGVIIIFVFMAYRLRRRKSN
ncbi:MAG: hypothetical protein ABW098_12320 [Candidatus Thiodiazotropha sp.]